MANIWEDWLDGFWVVFVLAAWGVEAPEGFDVAIGVCIEVCGGCFEELIAYGRHVIQLVLGCVGKKIKGDE